MRTEIERGIEFASRVLLSTEFYLRLTARSSAALSQGRQFLNRPRRRPEPPEQLKETDRPNIAASD